jgi:bacillithiol biosynthesis cysteine-adding enzyme BshC
MGAGISAQRGALCRCGRGRENDLALSFTDAWLAGEERARTLLPLWPWHREDRASAVATAAARTTDPGVLMALSAMNARTAPSEARARHLDALAAGGAAAVLTGQQAGLWLGPLYTFYKAAHAVALARWLSAEHALPVVPVFWVASEDHDFVEAAQCGLPTDGADPLWVRLGAPDPRPIPMAYRRLGEGITEANATLARELSGLPAGRALTALFEAHYRPEATWSDAFAHALAEVFAEEGLLVLDSRAPEVLTAAAPIHRQALDRAAELADALAGRAALLGQRGFDAPVHVRPGAPLSFVHPDGPEGPRYRIEPAGEGYALIGADGRTVDRGTLDRWLRDEPGRFSGSALLRPVVQDLLLPTAATVGGPGELAYLAQTPPLYEAFGRPMPMLAPRARFRVLSPRERRLCTALDLSPDDAASPRAKLLARLGAGQRPEGLPDPAGLEARVLGVARGELEALRTAGETLDRGLAKMVTRSEAALEKRIRRIADRYRRALATRDDVTTARLDRLAGALYPGGAPQERVFGLPALAAREGLAAFKARVLAACEPLPTQSKDIEP